MSYRELRNFIELMRALGYYRNISIENFRDPNFELVADILHWFALRYDPKMDISDDIEDEKDRVVFIRQVCQLFSSKARIILNPKKLYEATGNAVKEMLKVAEMMHKAMKTSEGLEQEEDMGSSSVMDFNIQSKLTDLKATRSLATEITESGAKLFDFLGSEKELKRDRDQALEFLDSISRNLDSNSESAYIEKCIGGIITNQTAKMTEMDETVKQLKLDEGELVNKLGRRQMELERAEKRLKGIENVKPEYQEEYEHLEAQLESFYTVYVEKFVNIDYLEHELDEYNLKDEQRRRNIEKTIEKFKDQQMEIDQKQMFDDEDRDGDPVFDKFPDQQMQAMRHNQKGFGGGQGHEAVGGLEPDDDDDDEDVSGSDDEEGIEQDDDDEEGSEHNF